MSYSSDSSYNSPGATRAQYTTSQRDKSHKKNRDYRRDESHHEESYEIHVGSRGRHNSRHRHRRSIDKVSRDSGDHSLRSHKRSGTLVDSVSRHTHHKSFLRERSRESSRSSRHHHSYERNDSCNRKKYQVRYTSSECHRSPDFRRSQNRKTFQELDRTRRRDQKDRTSLNRCHDHNRPYERSHSREENQPRDSRRSMRDSEEPSFRKRQKVRSSSRNYHSPSQQDEKRRTDPSPVKKEHSRHNKSSSHEILRRNRLTVDESAGNLANSDICDLHGNLAHENERDISFESKSSARYVSETCGFNDQHILSTYSGTSVESSKEEGTKETGVFLSPNVCSCVERPTNDVLILLSNETGARECLENTFADFKSEKLCLNTAENDWEQRPVVSSEEFPCVSKSNGGPCLDPLARDEERKLDSSIPVHEEVHKNNHLDVSENKEVQENFNESEETSIENKRLKRLSRIRKLMGDMKEKGLFVPVPLALSQETPVKLTENKLDMSDSGLTPVEANPSPNDGITPCSAGDKAEGGDIVQLVSSLPSPSLQSTVETDENVSEKNTDTGSEATDAIDSLDAYMAVITTEVEELQNMSSKKSFRRRHKKASGIDTTRTSQESSSTSQSITLEEILALQKCSMESKDVSLRAPQADALLSQDVELNPQHFSLVNSNQKASSNAEHINSDALSSSAPDCISVEREKLQEPELNSNEEVVSKHNGEQEADEEAYYEEFIKAIRRHKLETALSLGTPPSEEKAEVDIFVTNEQSDIPVKEKCEALDNPDDEDYRYNIINDASTQSYFDLVQKVGNKKELPVVDHASIEYPPFEKNIYVQVREIALMKDHEVDALRKLHGGIRVRGKHCPRPILNFYQCGLPNSILKIIEKKEYETPFPIQMQAMPALMAGRDVIGIAETGSGKTLAYLLPLIRHVLHQPPLRSNDGPIALVLAPTRELAVQIQREAHRYAKASGLRSTSVYGGTGIGDQLSALKRGSEIVIGTPGRLIDVLTINSGKILNLRRVTFCVLDEADRMFDMGFEPQITSILRNIRPDRQTAMFSATFPPVIENLARRILHKPIEILVGDKGQTASRIEQYIEVWSNYREKFLRLLQLLGEWNEHGSIIIFVSRQNEADELFAELLKYGYPSFVLHGGQDQADRDFTIQDFKEESKSILVATSVAARGLDVKSVVLVINFVAPDHLEDYVHRIGRTGRAGNIGVAYTFLTPQEGDKAEDLIKALKQSHRPVPEKVQELADEFRAKCNMGLACQHKKKGFGGKGFKFTSTEKSRQQQERQRVKKQMGMNESDNEDEGAYLDSEDFENPMAPMPATPPVTTGAIAPTPTPISDDVETASARAKALAELIAKQAPSATPSNLNSTAPNSILANPIRLASTSQILNPPTIALAMATSVPGAAVTSFPDNKTRQVAALRTTLQQQLGMGIPSCNTLPSTVVPPNVQRALSMPATASAAAAVAAATAAGLSLKSGSAASFPGSTGGIPGLSSMAYVDQATGNAVDEFEINDYPQYARFKIMHKDILHRIADHTGAVLQVKGRYVSPEEKDSTLVVGVKRLYIEIIGATPIIVQRAKHEIRTLLEAVSLKQLNVGTNARPSGRYSVI